MYFVTRLVAFYHNNTFVYDPNIFPRGYICYYVELIFLNNIFVGCKIWTKPSNFSKQKSEKLQPMA